MVVVIKTVGLWLATLGLLIWAGFADADHETTVDGPTPLHWQCECEDGSKTRVHVAPVYNHNRDWTAFNGIVTPCETRDDCAGVEQCRETEVSRGRFTGPICARFLPVLADPPAPEGSYNTHVCDEECAPLDVKDAGGSWLSISKRNGWYHGDNVPAYPLDHPMIGPDSVDCNCLGSRTRVCFDSDGPEFVPPEDERFMTTERAACSAACATRFGAFMSATSATGLTILDDPACDAVGLPEDRGPEIHCRCPGDGVSGQSNTWCGDSPTVCTDRGCEVHHGPNPTSTRCIPPPDGSGSTSTTTTTTLIPNRCLYGDTNGNNDIDIVDALCTVYCVVGVSYPGCDNIDPVTCD